MNRSDIVDKIRTIMKGMIPSCQTILYGSQARGDARPDSDIDLLILVDGDNLSVEDEKKIASPLFSLEIESGINISPLIMLRKTWESRPFKTPFSLNIEKDGIVL